MKICVYNVTSTMDLPGTSEVGGTEEFSFRFAEACQDMGHQVTIVGGQPREGARARATSVPLMLFPYRATGSFPNLGTRFRKLAQRIHFARQAMPFVKGENFDLVLAFKPYDLVPFKLNGIRSRSRVLLRFGGTDFFPSDRVWRSAANAFFANSEATAEKVSERFGVSCPVIPNGVSVPENPAIIGARCHTILSAGRLVAWKGFSTLLTALSPLRNRKGWKLVLFGEGPERAMLEGLVEEFGLAGKVEMPGAVSPKDVARRLLEGGLYVQPSIGFDSCPNAVMEAMAAGLPAVVSSQVGLPTGFEPGRHGLVFPAGDNQLLAEEIIRFINDPASFARMGGEARRLVCERHTLDRVARQILELAR